MKMILSALLLTAAVSAHAACIGSGAFQSCTDSSGNSYTVNRFGNTTMVQGSNPNGSQWNQTSQTIGNTTFHNGQAANGQSWNGTTINSPNMQQHFGTDSQGRSYHKVCTTAGCF